MPTSSDEKSSASKSLSNRALQPFAQANEHELRQEFSRYQRQFEHQNQSVNYAQSSTFENVALYTPALSDGYINNVTRLAERGRQAKANGTPEQDPLISFDFDADDLKFINPKSKLFFYPWVLFSGGQGARNEVAAKSDNWVTIRKGRDKRVVVIGDSGGFQIQQQTIPFDPNTTPKRMLEWLERVADQSMVLDFPTGGIATGAMVPHVQQLIAEGIDVFGEAKRTGFSSGFIAALTRTCQNNAYFKQHRAPGATNLLNVIQGRNEKESAYWYDQVKGYPFEGWAFAGKHSVQISMTLRRLIQMRDDGILGQTKWIHFLGVSTLKVGVALSFIQRALREHTDAKQVQLTFDSKSPVDTMVNGYQAITGYDFDPAKWSVHTEGTNLLKYSKSDALLVDMARSWVDQGEHRRLAQSTLGHVLRLKDLVAKRNSITGKRVPSSVQQTLLVHHNTQALIEGFRYAYRLLDHKYLLERAPSIQFMDMLIREVFSSSDPMALIDDFAPQLDALAYEGAFGK